MQPHQQRVIDERADLDSKCKKLSDFMGADIFNSLGRLEQDRLRRQFGWMCGYRAVLDERIAAFEG